VEETSAEDEQSNGNGNGHSNGHNIGRMAAIAAASGATAYAAKKALESRSSSSGGSDDEDEGSSSKSKSAKGSKKRAQTGASLAGAAVSSGWDVAKDSLLPIIEDAATKAGAYAAESTPEVVRDVVIPRFISGFEKARKKRGGDEDE